MPLVAVVVIVINIYVQRPGYEMLPFVAVAVAILGTISGGIIFRLVKAIAAGCKAHAAATARRKGISEVRKFSHELPR